jgi:Uma2 family endonuclease
LHFREDDGIVVEEETMFSRMTVSEYLSTEETNQPRELAYGFVREPPAPTFHHQIIVGQVYDRLNRHVCRRNTGVVVMSPVDVILDRDRALVVQPDLVFVRAERVGICRDRIWGAPDLVVEVLSMGNLRHDRTVKLDWYGTYGVPECWLVDTMAWSITVVDLTAEVHTSRTFDGDKIIRSRVLPRLRLRASAIFNQ